MGQVEVGLDGLEGLLQPRWFCGSKSASPGMRAFSLDFKQSGSNGAGMSSPWRGSSLCRTSFGFVPMIDARRCWERRFEEQWRCHVRCCLIYYLREEMRENGAAYPRPDALCR